MHHSHRWRVPRAIGVPSSGLGLHTSHGTHSTYFGNLSKIKQTQGFTPPPMVYTEQKLFIIIAEANNETQQVPNDS